MPPTALRNLAPLLHFMVVGLASVPAAAQGAAIVVRVTGVGAAGEVGCSLYKAADAARFPLGGAGMPQVWRAADAHGATCRFDNLPAGRYAVAVAQNLNGNRTVETRLFGIPTEAWGVSNNVRPSMRPPRFDEAAFDVSADASDVVIDVALAR